MNTTINPAEIEKFTSIADQWWNEKGSFKPLHKFNPIRIGYIRDTLASHFGEIKNLKILDIGCGGGLLTEPLFKLGINMTGIDAGGKNIEAAKIHAANSGLKIDYRHIDVEKLANSEEKFDAVLAMEIIEHVADVNNFIAAASDCLKPNGLIFIATLNRTIKSYLKAIIGAEYVLKWLPRGTHDWKNFLKPSEIYKIASQNNLNLIKSNGFEYNLLKDDWKISDNLDVNYIMIFKK